MVPRLETIPHDILHLIAYLSGSSSVFDPPVEILRLMQTNSTIYDSLETSNAPHVYARVFATKFDTSAPFRRYQSTITDSALAAELSNRSRLLKRIQRREISISATLMQDLWTALWMLLESDGLNEQQLASVGFVDFILNLARLQLKPARQGPENSSDLKALEYIIIWLLTLALPTRVILDMSTHNRDELYSLIFPYIFLSNKPQVSTCTGCSLAQTYCKCRLQPSKEYKEEAGQVDVSIYLQRQLVELPDPSIAAINLACVLLESTPLKMPYHLPETRAIAIANQRSGPTKEDYRALGSYRTPLFADSMPSLTPGNSSNSVAELQCPRSTLHDLEFGDILGSISLDNQESSDTFTYTPGTMTGVWEGLYRMVHTPIVSGPSLGSIPPLLNMGLVKPMQCALTEYFCEDGPPSEEDDIMNPDFCSSNLFDDLIQDHNDVNVRGYKYRRHSSTPTVSPLRNATEDAKPPCDMVLLGQTLDDHDQAWGGYNFWGKVHKDGRVVLKRAAKDQDESQGIWLFDGRLRFGTTIIGRWRMMGASDNVDHGIFSLGKVLTK